MCCVDDSRKRLAVFVTVIVLVLVIGPHFVISCYIDLKTQLNWGENFLQKTVSTGSAGYVLSGFVGGEVRKPGGVRRWGIIGCIIACFCHIGGALGVRYDLLPLFMISQGFLDCLSGGILMVVTTTNLIMHFDAALGATIVGSTVGLSAVGCTYAQASLIHFVSAEVCLWTLAGMSVLAIPAAFFFKLPTDFTEEENEQAALEEEERKRIQEEKQEHQERKPLLLNASQAATAAASSGGGNNSNNNHSPSSSSSSPNLFKKKNPSSRVSLTRGNENVDDEEESENNNNLSYSPKNSEPIEKQQQQQQVQRGATQSMTTTTPNVPVVGGPSTLSTTPSQSGPEVISRKESLTNPVFWSLFFTVAFSISPGFAMISTYNEMFSTALKVSNFHGALYVGLVNALYCLGRIFGGILCRHLGVKKWGLIILAVGIIFTGLAPVAEIEDVPWLFVVCVCLAAAQLGASQVYAGPLTVFLFQKHNVGSVYGLIMWSVAFAQVVGPLILLAQTKTEYSKIYPEDPKGRYNFFFWISSFVLLVAFILLIFLKENSGIDWTNRVRDEEYEKREQEEGRREQQGGGQEGGVEDEDEDEERRRYLGGATATATSSAGSSAVHHPRSGRGGLQSED